MASIADISQVLGDYMLKGWVLTDQSCPTPGCAVPLVRSPSGRTPITTICAKCGSGNSSSSQSQNAALASPSNASTETQQSRSSTPPTEFSEAPGSPVFVPIQESEETRRRRAQSDQASSEIGKRLLKGWAMLGDECPNSTCYGVPLVRPPKSGGERDPRKECVVCGNVYVSKIDWAGRETLVPQETKASVPTDDSVRSQAGSSQARVPSSPTSSQEKHSFSSPFGHQLEEKDPAQTQTQLPLPQVPHSSSGFELNPKETAVRTEIIYDETSQSLRASLHTLSNRLTSLTSYPTLEPGAIGSTADAIAKVAQALVQMKELERVQNR
ncbi:hypothetical protein CVT25_010871 [Psilocybe cyanescens]|uniref:Uncharacterized protein n=1 Tax=Psilocybe cyanescens TaxID=93625 RepID=A0A409WFJ1_PSICY|nr:hypothetical protein CVT25_010871 [Psilocybe cyanescens]